MGTNVEVSPEKASLPDTKLWWASRGVVGSVISVGCFVAAMYGLEISEADKVQAVEVGVLLVGAVSSVIALIGRVKAKKQIGG